MIAEDQPHRIGCGIDPAIAGPTVLPNPERTVSLRMYLMIYVVFFAFLALGAFIFLNWF